MEKRREIQEKSEIMKIGDNASIRKVITDEDILTIAKLGDTNPLHLDDEFARKMGFKGRIAHGIISINLISTVLGTMLPGNGTILLSQNMNFRAPVYSNDTITATVEVIKIREKIITLKTDCYNQYNEPVLIGKVVVKKSLNT